MKSEGMAKHFVLAFVFALAIYVLVYQLIEHRRTRNGPWQVAFTTNSAGAPLVSIAQPALGITNVQLVFPGGQVPATNLPVVLTFAEPRPVPYALPFGQCVFVDSTFLPGTLTFDMFGHEIELLPRVLILDRKEHPWKSDETIEMGK